MKVLILDENGYQKNMSFIHHNGSYKKGDTIFEPCDKQLWIIKEIEIVDHFIHLHCEEAKIKK